MSERQTPDTNLDPRCQSGPSAKSSVIPGEGDSFKELWSWPTPAADFRSSLWQIPYSNTCSLEDKIQDWGMYLFTISYGSYAVDQRSGDGWICGWSKIFVFYQKNSNTRFWGIRRENCFASRKRSVWRKWKLKKKTASSEEDRSLTWSTSTSGSLEPMILSITMPTYSQFLFEILIFRNSIRNGTEFYYQWRKSHLMTSWQNCTNKEYESLINSRPYWNCMTWRLIRRS